MKAIFWIIEAKDIFDLQMSRYTSEKSIWRVLHDYLHSRCPELYVKRNLFESSCIGTSHFLIF